MEILKDMVTSQIIADWRSNNIEESVNGKCCNCGGVHTPDFLECPIRVKEVDQGCAVDLLCGGGEESKGKEASVEDMAVDALQPVDGVKSIG